MKRGFTIVELIVVIVVASFVTGLFLVQKADARLRGEDSSRKQDINAIHYYLEGVYYAANKNYPEKLDAKMLSGLDPQSFIDPTGSPINAKNGDYTYKPSGCGEGRCSGYKLTAVLAQEAPFSQANLAH